MQLQPQVDCHRPEHEQMKQAFLHDVVLLVYGHFCFHHYVSAGYWLWVTQVSQVPIFKRFK